MKSLTHLLLAASSLVLAACSSRIHTETVQATVSNPAAPLGMAPPLTAANTAPTGEADPTGPTAPHSNARELMQSGAYAAQNGIQLSQLALTKDISADTKELAARIIKDYTNSLTFLKPVADHAGVALPTDMDAAHKIIITSLAKLDGQTFEILYTSQSRKNSQVLANTLAAYRQLKLTQMEDMQTWIGVTIPIAENHLGALMKIIPGETKH